jgi:hypothetical protein
MEMINVSLAHMVVRVRQDNSCKKFLTNILQKKISMLVGVLGVFT